MKGLRVVTGCVFLLALTMSAGAQDAAKFLGRWDMTVTPADGKPYPQWIELTEDGGRIGGRVQPRGGAWHAIDEARVEGGKLVVTVGKGNDGVTTWELASDGAGRSTGVEKDGGTDGPKLAGVMAPKLDRPMPKKWTKPEPLFDGKDLSGWEPVGNVDNSKWIARDGELVNDNPEVPGKSVHGAANIMTTRKF